MQRGSRRVGREETHAAVGIRKGPWQAEEDNVLMDYVAKHGPHDWSSIRSKGLLPRTGKSCRLRWVNKLKPGLKTGLKFSPEEEGIVIDLQERFGNKWARIATYLPGRTDNDVKNFWSTRQKRLSRLMQSPLPIAPAPFSNFENTNSTALSCNSPCLDLIPLTEQCSNSQFIHEPREIEDSGSAEPVSVVNPEANSRPTLDHHLFDLPPLPEAQDLVLEFDDLPLPDHIAGTESFHGGMRLPEAPAIFDMDVGRHELKIKHPETPESFFDDFPSDMFDYLELPPPGK